MICSKTLRFGVILAAVTALGGLPALSGAGDISDLRGLVLNNAKIPVYGKKLQELQMMIFVNSANREGRLITGETTVLDLIRNNANVDAISDAWGISQYPLNSNFNQVLKFWTPRAGYSDGVIITDQAAISQDDDRAMGEEPVFFRSPLIDLDGIGFEVDFKARTIQVNSEVQLILRTGKSDPRKYVSGGFPEIYDFVRASSDSLLIDVENNQVMLIGSVRVRDRKSLLTCDRLTIILSGERRSGKDVAGFEAAESGDGLAKILADGNVVITDGDPDTTVTQRAVADHLVYDVPAGTFTFTGDNRKRRPHFDHNLDSVSGQKIILYRDQEVVEIPENCVIVSRDDSGKRRVLTSKSGRMDFLANRGAFTGDVKIVDGDMTVTGPLAELELSAQNKPENGNPEDEALLPGTLGMKAPGSSTGSRTLDRVVFPQGIKVTGGGKTSPYDLTAKEGIYRTLEKELEFRNDVLLNDTQMALSTDSMRILMKEKVDAASTSNSVDRIICQGNLKIEGRGANSGTLVSDRGEMLYQQDFLVFEKSVKVSDQDTVLDCDRLELYLADSSNSGKKTPRQDNVIGSMDSNKLLQKAVAVGNVVMTNPDSRLDTGKLTMLFEELPEGAVPARGMLHSGSTQLVWIACDDSMRLENRGEKGSLDAVPGFGSTSGVRTAVADRSETDLKTKESRLFGNVKIEDAENQLVCDKMTLFGAVPDENPAVEETVDKEQQTVDFDPDADPFELAQTENSIPGKLLIGPDLELKRVLCEDNVVVSTKDKDKKYLAGGDVGEYLASTRKMVIYSLPPRYAWLKGEGRKQWCQRIVYDVAADRIYGEGGTFTADEKRK